MAQKRSGSDHELPETANKRTAPGKLIADLRELINSTRTGVARAVNSSQALLYWQVG
jgi:hypothetical protein